MFSFFPPFGSASLVSLAVGGLSCMHDRLMVYVCDLLHKRKKYVYGTKNIHMKERERDRDSDPCHAINYFLLIEVRKENFPWKIKRFP